MGIPQTRYARSGDLQIAYQVVGEGPLDVVLFPDDDVGGLAVHIGARISSLAGPGEVLISSTVRDLSIGSGQTLVDRGEHDLKGVPGPWRVFAVET